jgi:basic membrane protein A
MNKVTIRRFLYALILYLTASSFAQTSGGLPPLIRKPDSTPPATKQRIIRAAWIYVGPVGDAGWTYSHDLGRKAVEEKFGGAVRTTFVEKVPEGVESERVIRDLAKRGNDIIFATSFGYMDSMLKISAEFPNIKFEHATGYKTSPNMRIYDISFFHGAYMAGVIAGNQTKTNILGFVGSFPIPEVLRNVNAFTLGAQSVNSSIKTRVAWVNTWYDPSAESRAAQDLMNQGADVLLQNTDSTAVLQTAEMNGRFAFGWDSDMSQFATKAHLGSVIGNWGPYYIRAIEEVRSQTWKTERTVWGVADKSNDIVKISNLVPQDIRLRVQKIKDEIGRGTFEIFSGPIIDNTGKVRLSKGQRADQAWKDRVDFYVMGIEGVVPR